MNKSEFIDELESLMELKKGTLIPSTNLLSITQWDSMAKLSLIVLLSEKFSLKISSSEINNFNTIQDILKFVKLL
jgi:acyl carrier protein